MRRTGPADRTAVRRLFRHPAFAAWAGDASDEVLAAKYLGGRSPEVECFLVEYEREIVGFTQFHGAAGEGGMDLILLPESRGRGIGSAVVHEVVGLVRLERGWRRFTVDPDVCNDGGVRFWRNVGFVPERIVRDDPDREPYWVMAWPL